MCGAMPGGDGERESASATADFSGHIAAGVRPTDAQRRYLERGLTQPGGKLPLFDRDGREVPKRTVESCVAHGWATTLGGQSDQARLAGLPADRGRLPGARRHPAGHGRGDKSTGTGLLVQGIGERNALDGRRPPPADNPWIAMFKPPRAFSAGSTRRSCTGRSAACPGRRNDAPSAPSARPRGSPTGSA
jgi:hypothetical protein